MKVTSKQITGTEANKTPIPSSKPKRKTTKIANRHNIKRTYGQPSEQLFPKGWPLRNSNRTKIIYINIRLNVTETNTKNRQQRTTTQPPPWNGQYNDNDKFFIASGHRPITENINNILWKMYLLVLEYTRSSTNYHIYLNVVNIFYVCLSVTLYRYRTKLNKTGSSGALISFLNLCIEGELPHSEGIYLL